MAGMAEDMQLFGASGAESDEAGQPLPVDDRQEPVSRPMKDPPRPVTTQPGASGVDGLVPLYEISMIFPLCTDGGGEGYHRLALMLANRTLVAAVPVKTDQGGTSLLLAVPLTAIKTESQP